MKRCLALCVMIVFFCSSYLHAFAVKNEPVLRALLIGSDYYVSQLDTWPASDTNLRLMADLLADDARGYGLIRSLSSVVATVPSFKDAVCDAFANADENDISVLYLSMHGVFEMTESGSNVSMLLSDGVHEEKLDAVTLRQILDDIQGEIVVILDGCYSGAFIGKGMEMGDSINMFSLDRFHFLTSAGGCESSWYWRGANIGNGASYFATILTDALGNGSDHAADANQDGIVTFYEAYQYMMEHYAASTPQIYPQREQQFPLFCYVETDRNDMNAIVDISFDDAVLIAGNSELNFSFTVQRQVELYYQIVYHQNGEWQFANSSIVRDEEQLDGTVLPGRKQRSLQIETNRNEYGYVMIQFVTVENQVPLLVGEQLISIQPYKMDWNLHVETDSVFCPEFGDELAILVETVAPCSLTLGVYDQNQKMIRRLCYANMTRPQQILQNGCTFYWDGRDNRDQLVAPGFYIVKVSVAGDASSTVGSAEFELTMLKLAEKDPQW